jgi:hypothetical protein
MKLRLGEAKTARQIQHRADKLRAARAKAQGLAPQRLKTKAFYPTPSQRAMIEEAHSWNEVREKLLAGGMDDVPSVQALSNRFGRKRQPAAGGAGDGEGGKCQRRGGA